MWFSFGDGFESKFKYSAVSTKQWACHMKIWNEEKEEEEICRTIGRKIFLTIYFDAFEKNHVHQHGICYSMALLLLLLL